MIPELKYSGNHNFFWMYTHARIHTHTHTHVRAHRKRDMLSVFVCLFHEMWYLTIFQKSFEKIQVSLKSDNKNNMSHEDQYTFMIISHSLLLRMRNVSDKSCRGNHNTHFMFSNLFLKIVSFMRCCGKIIVSGCFGVVV